MKNKEIINEHDLTKKMLDVIRFGINESEEGNDVISPSPSDSVYAEELKKISDTLDTGLQITKFKIYPNDRDVQLEGRLDVGINFFMSTKATTLSISITDNNGTASRIYIDDKIIGHIQRLNGYYDNWSREWIQKLNTEYKPK